MREPLEIRRSKRRRKQKRISRIRTILEVIMVLTIVIGYNYYTDTIDSKDDIISKAQTELDSTLKNIELILETNTGEDGIIPTIEEIVTNTQDMKAELAAFREREELYNKYEYVLFYGNKRTDMTYDLLKHGEDLMLKENIDPNLLFGLIMVESRAVEKAQNSTSSARGFCQLISSTARSIYENHLKKGKYNHTMAFDGYTNMEIGAKLIAMNMEKYNGDTYTVIQRYRGLSDVGTYYSAVDKFVNRGGTTLRQIATRYRE